MSRYDLMNYSDLTKELEISVVDSQNFLDNKGIVIKLDDNLSYKDFMTVVYCHNSLEELFDTLYAMFKDLVIFNNSFIRILNDSEFLKILKTPKYGICSKYYKMFYSGNWYLNIDGLYFTTF